MTPELNMRIGIDARITYYARGGIRNYVLHLLQALAGVDADTDYYVLHSRKDRSPPLPGPNFHPLACWTPSHHRLERWALGMEIARLGLDLVHSTDFIPPAWGYCRSVVTVHDLNFLHYPQFITPESHRYYTRQIAWAVRRASHVLADSHATLSDLVSLLKVRPEKITVVHLAADPAFRPLPEARAAQVAARYNLEPGYLLFVGTLEPRKNLPGLLQAYRDLLDAQVTTAPLVVVGGKGWLYDEIFERVAALRLTDQVRFLHDVPDDDLPGLYNAASLLTTPSFYEGFGLPALEAMACGTPTVASATTSLPEVCGEGALSVPPQDEVALAEALHRLATDETLRHDLRARGIAQAARFPWSETARKTAAAYRQALHE